MGMEGFSNGPEEETDISSAESDRKTEDDGVVYFEKGRRLSGRRAMEEARRNIDDAGYRNERLSRLVGPPVDMEDIKERLLEEIKRKAEEIAAEVDELTAEGLVELARTELDDALRRGDRDSDEFEKEALKDAIRVMKAAGSYYKSNRAS